MFSGLDIFFHPRHDPVFLFAYNARRTIEFTLSWIFFLEKFGPGFFLSSSPAPIKIKWSLPNSRYFCIKSYDVGFY